MNAPAEPSRLQTDPRHDASREIRAPRGTSLSCKSWLTEAAYRMLQNNLDPEVAEDPKRLVVYGGIGRAARDWACFDAILATLRELDDDESLLVQSGKPVGEPIEGLPANLWARGGQGALRSTPRSRVRR